MNTTIDAGTLHRTAKYFMDNGRAQTHEEALAILGCFGLTIRVGPEIMCSLHHQVALLTLVNVTRRTLLGGVEIVALPDVQNLSVLARGDSLRDAVRDLGGQLVSHADGKWPIAVIGDAPGVENQFPCWRLTWDGWRGGVIPLRNRMRFAEVEAMPLTPILAAAACAAEVFAYHAGDQPMAGRRCSGLSLWRPGEDWLKEDPSENRVAFLPSRLWIVGLGNLGQAFAWGLAALPYADRTKVQLVLQDFDHVSEANESTSLLSFLPDVGRKKARVVTEWLERRGFATCINELRFGASTRRGDNEPGVALCGVDNPSARAALERVGFSLVVEAGLGAGPEAFRSMSVHTFPSSQSAEKIWSSVIGNTDQNHGNMPAYEALKRAGMDKCGLAQLASQTVAVPFVGLIAACLVVSELLRRLNGGGALELVSGSAAALGDMKAFQIESGPYAFGHLTVG